MATAQSRIVSPQPVTPSRPPAPPPPNVLSAHPTLSRMRSKWMLMDDCLSGEEAVKSRKELYLPIPRVDDDESENKKRYSTYIQRAVFYNATRRTLDGLVGEVFSRDPVMKLPENMARMATDVDGAGVSIVQQAKLALSYVMGYGRAALLIDYPKVDGPVTQDRINSGEVRPTISLYKANTVINWRTKMIGAERVYTLVVIAETYLNEDDPFETRSESQWRVLRLNSEGVYEVEIWRKRTRDPIAEEKGAEPPSEELYQYEKYIPTDAQGKVWTRIPFTFVGVMNNDSSIDDPPMYDLAVLNIAHYRNSADYEESCFIVGQPTAWFSGLTQEWVTDVFKGKVFLGSRAAIPLPQGAMAGLLQVSPNSMPKEAMDQKERQMVALGAKLVTNGNVQRTLGEAQIEEASASSILATATKNVSAAYLYALKVASRFITPVEPADTDLRFDLNTDFPASRLTPNDRNQLIQEWQSGAITWTEMRDGLRRGGVATMDDAKAKSDIEANPPPNVVKEQEEAAREAALAAKDTRTRPNNAPNGGNQAGQ